MRSPTLPRHGPRAVIRPGVALVVGLALVLLSLSTGTIHRAAADDGCDPSEPVACIPLPPEPPATLPPAQQPANSAAAPSIAVAVPVPGYPCPLGPLTGSVPASPAVPVPPVRCCPPPLPNPYGTPVPVFCCAPVPPSPGVAVPQSPIVPVPSPYYCPPYRSIYATINGGNVADVRALRTLSIANLRSYWRQAGLETIQGQIADLQYRGVYATPTLYSIAVQDASFPSPGTAIVHTMEHWRYQERLQGDGTVVFDQDQWVANEYDLSLIGNAWYITYNNATLTGA
ncbi:MAG: hypothetical protein ACR2PL_15730 [Dehalococcoidia bacterium]